MCKNIVYHKFIAILLSLSLAVGLLPNSVKAETVNYSLNPDSEVISSEELSPTVPAQSVSPDTRESELDLPEVSSTTGSAVTVNEVKEPGPVERVSGEITSFVPLADELRWQNTDFPSLPDTVSGIVVGKATDISITWEADHDYDPVSPTKGLYVFTARVDSGYTIADGVEIPRITVYIHTAQPMLMSMLGTGTSDSALRITTAAQLAEIATLANMGRLETFLFNDSQATVYLSLGNDIDLSAYGEGWNDSKGWVPIGTVSYPFKGMFDGCGYKITGLYINDSNLKSAGLFGNMNGCMVQNLGVADVNITGSCNLGGLAGYVDHVSIKNCYATGTITGTIGLVGGIVGSFYGSKNDTGITYCYASCKVTGGSRVGGVAGYFDNNTYQNSNITNCYASCEITGTGSGYFGGIAGFITGNITNCYASGEIDGAVVFIGGIAGQMGGYINNCVALNLIVNGKGYVGRVAGNDNYPLSNNAAFSGMKVMEYNSPISIISDSTGKDGLDMDAAAIIADGTLGGRFTAENDWTVEDGKLPGIGQAVEIPQYIVDGSDLTFVGAGTVQNPYQIGSAEQLAALAALVLNGNQETYNLANYVLTADIDLSVYGKSYDGGKGWLPIGYNTFYGNFDGCGHTISGLYINRPTAQNTGLFGGISNGSVKNLGVIDAVVTGTGNVGGVVGYANNSKISSCYSTGTFTGTGEAVGGVVGYLNGDNGSMINCYSTGMVSGSKGVGGVAGSVIDGIVSRCYSTGTIIGTSECAGGVVGEANNSNDAAVQNCAALNPDINVNSNAARILGFNFGIPLSGNAAFSGIYLNGSTVTSGNADSVNGVDEDAAAISGAGFFQSLFSSDSAWSYTDGKLPILAGFAENVQNSSLPYHINGSYFDGGNGISEEEAYEISTAEQLVKLAELINAGENGDFLPFSISCYKLTADIDLSGYNASNTCFNSGKGWVPIGIYTKAFSGRFNGNKHKISGLYINDSSLDNAGLFGYVSGNAAIKDLSVTGVNVTGHDHTGSVAGYLSGDIIYCNASGMVSGTDYVGGMAGWMTQSNTASYCSTSGTVSGNNYVGGMAGSLEGSCIMHSCYSSDIVSGESYIGGLAGYVAANSEIRNCYSTGIASGNSYIGGLAGNTAHNGRITNCYTTDRVLGESYVGGVSVISDDSKVINCAALNPSVSGSSSVRRVAEQSDSTLFCNYAFSGMSGGGSNNTAGGPDGADVTIAQMNTAAFWTDTNNWYNPSLSSTIWDPAFWLIQNGKLPVLQKVNGVQTGDSGLYLTERDIKYTAVTLDAATYTYDGSLKMPVPTVTFDGMTLVKDKDYDVSIMSVDGESTSAGIQAGTVSLTLTGRGNYSGTKQVSFTIGKAPAPTLSWPAAASITYGDMLSHSILTGGSTTYGSFAWTSGNTAPSAGNGSYSVTFTPNAATAANYEAITDATHAVEITVNKAPAPTLSWPTAASITYGDMLSHSILTGGSTTYGSFAWTSGNTVPSAGNGSYSVTFTPNAATAANYEVISTTTHVMDITVNKAPAPFIPPYIFNIYCGTTSVDNTIDLAAFLPADCGADYYYSVTSTNTLLQNIFVNPFGKLSFDILSSDHVTTENVTVKVVMQNYEDVTLTTTVNFVHKKVPTVAPIVSGSLTYGQPLSTLTINATALEENSSTPVSGSIKWTTPTGKPTASAPAQSWTFTPNDTVVYEIVTGTVDITVNKAVPQGTPSMKLISTTGKKLSDAALTVSFTNPYDGSPIPGTLCFDLPDTTTITMGTAYSWTFTPDDTSNCCNITGFLIPYPVGSDSSSSSGGNSVSNSPATVSTPAPEKEPNLPVAASVSVAAVTDKNRGIAIAVIPDKVVNEMIVNAQSEAKAQGKTADSISVVVYITIPKKSKIISLRLSPSALKALEAAGVSSFKMISASISVSFDQKALHSIRSQSKGDVTITAASWQKLSKGAKNMIGIRPVYNISVGYTKKGKPYTVSNLGSGTATVSIPYTPAKEEAIGCLYAVYINGKSKATRINHSVYDTDSGCMIFSTNHFSIYGIGYSAPSEKFSDTSKHWAADSIDYAVSRGFLTGTTKTAFSPDTAITRGMLVTVLGRLAEVDVSIYKTSSFTDVEADQSYVPYIEWACKKGIIQSAGNNQFAPERAVTREEFAVIFLNFIKATGYTLPVTREAVTFADSYRISSDCKGAVTALQQAGIMLGDSSSNFSPKVNVTRAEVCSMLLSFIKLKIDPTTAQG